MKAEDKYDKTRVSLGLYEDDKGVLRSEGRLQYALLSYEGRFPAILPRKHHVTQLIIKRHHSKVMHYGLKDTQTDLRTKSRSFAASAKKSTSELESNYYRPMAQVSLIDKLFV